jgi:hypothetical protein
MGIVTDVNTFKGLPRAFAVHGIAASIACWKNRSQVAFHHRYTWPTTHFSFCSNCAQGSTQCEYTALLF